jgi:hypothetical protein
MNFILTKFVRLLEHKEKHHRNHSTLARTGTQKVCVWVCVRVVRVCVVCRCAGVCLPECASVCADGGRLLHGRGEKHRVRPADAGYSYCCCRCCGYCC